MCEEAWQAAEELDRWRTGQHRSAKRSRRCTLMHWVPDGRDRSQRRPSTQSRRPWWPGARILAENRHESAQLAALPNHVPFGWKDDVQANGHEWGMDGIMGQLIGRIPAQEVRFSASIRGANLTHLY